jgi:hypothetical protein
VGDPVLDPEFAELVRQRLAVVGLVGVVGRLVALDHGFAPLTVV